MTLPTPMKFDQFDRGEPLTPEQVAERVRPRRQAVAPWEEREFTARMRVVVHPQVFEDIELVVAPLFTGARRGDSPLLRYFHERVPAVGTEPMRRELRVCGLLMETDPGLRLDEVVLRREERL